MVVCVGDLLRLNTMADAAIPKAFVPRRAAALRGGCHTTAGSSSRRPGVGQIDRTAKADRRAAVQAGPHQQELGGEVA
jgi:hypothetical protein